MSNECNHPRETWYWDKGCYFCGVCKKRLSARDVSKVYKAINQTTSRMY